MGDWTKAQIEQLKNLYVEHDIPSDELLKDKAKLEEFAKALNSRFDNDAKFGTEEVAGQLLRLRKTGKLPRIRRW
jgi:hypothetical protein